jgi:hypothetical protein
MTCMNEAGLNSAILADPLLSHCGVRTPGDWPQAAGVAIWAFGLSWLGGRWGG